MLALLSKHSWCVLNLVICKETFSKDKPRAKNVNVATCDSSGVLPTPTTKGVVIKEPHMKVGSNKASW